MVFCVGCFTGQQPVFDQGEVAQVGFEQVVEKVTEDGDNADKNVDEDVEDLECQLRARVRVGKELYAPSGLGYWAVHRK
jgi:hypothetical protein